MTMIPIGGTMAVVGGYFQTPVDSDPGAAYIAGVLADEPVGFWMMNETEGTTAFDLSGFDRHGTWIGSPALGEATGIPSALGGVGADLNGSSQYVSVPHSAAFNFGNVMGLEAWVRRDATGASHTIWNKGAGNVQVRCATNDKLQVLRSDYGSQLATTGDFIDGVLSHVVFNRNGTGTTFAVYIDGTLRGITVADDVHYDNNSTALAIGAKSSASEFFAGPIVAAAAYAAPLDEDRVEAHYALGSA